MNQNTQALVATYNAALSAANDDPTTVTLSAVSHTYAAIPAAARGAAMAAALRTVTNFDAMGDILNAHNNLPTASSRVEKRTLTERESDAIRSYLTFAVKDVVFGMLNADDEAWTEEWAGTVGDTDNPFTDQFVAEALIAAGEKLVASVEKLNVGTTARRTHNVEPTDVVPAGSELVCTYKGGNVTAVLNADNTVSIGSDTYDSLSAAATVVTGSDTANGWVHWRYAGQKLAAIRDAS